MKCPVISITPHEALSDEVISIRLANFDPNQLVTLRAEIHSFPTITTNAYSFATFKTDENGTVDLAFQKPLYGSYSDPDPMGMFWSMEMFDTKYNLTTKMSELHFNPTTSVRFSAEVNGGVATETEFNFHHMDPDVVIQDVMMDGLVGKYFYKPMESMRPCVIVLGGGDGGLAPQLNYAALFASHGFPSLALAYYNFEHLPRRFREIPLEYFKDAINWCKKQQTVDAQKIIVYGRSKGAELALLLGATYPDIHAVISSSPNGYVCIGDFEETEKGVKRYSSWSHHGHPLPFIDWSPELCTQFNDCIRTSNRINLLHRAAFENAPNKSDCRIPVENIRGSILLISSDDDHWWDASFHAEEITKHLKQSKFPHRVVWRNYKDTGHVIRYPNFPTTQLIRNGGTPYNNAIAIRDAWQHTIQFLNDCSSIISP